MNHNEIIGTADYIDPARHCIGLDHKKPYHRHASGYIGNGKFSSAGSCKTRFCPMCGRPLKEASNER